MNINMNINYIQFKIIKTFIIYLNDFNNYGLEQNLEIFYRCSVIFNETSFWIEEQKLNQLENFFIHTCFPKLKKVDRKLNYLKSLLIKNGYSVHYQIDIQLITNMLITFLNQEYHQFDWNSIIESMNLNDFIDNNYNNVYISSKNITLFFNRLKKIIPYN